MSSPEPIWNVRLPVIALIPAASADEAIALLRSRLSDDGWDVYDDADEEAAGYRAFESEELPPEIEAGIRADWRCPFTSWGVQCVRSVGHDDPDDTGGHRPPDDAWWRGPGLP